MYYRKAKILPSEDSSQRTPFRLVVLRNLPNVDHQLFSPMNNEMALMMNQVFLRLLFYTKRAIRLKLHLIRCLISTGRIEDGLLYYTTKAALKKLIFSPNSRLTKLNYWLVDYRGIQ